MLSLKRVRFLSNVVPVDAEYIKNMIHEMYINSEENADKTA